MQVSMPQRVGRWTRSSWLWAPVVLELESHQHHQQVEQVDEYAGRRDAAAESEEHSG